MMKQLVLMFVCFVFAAGAWATKPQMPLGFGNKSLGAAQDKEAKNMPLSVSEKAIMQDYEKDAAEYQQVGDKLWPLCTVGGASDMAPDCANLSPDLMKGSYPIAQSGINGPTFRSKISPEEAKVLGQRMLKLEQKWNQQ